MPRPLKIAALFALGLWPILLFGGFVLLEVFRPRACSAGKLDWLPRCELVTNVVQTILGGIDYLAYFAAWYYQITLLLWFASIVLALVLFWRWFCKKQP